MYMLAQNIILFSLPAYFVLNVYKSLPSTPKKKKKKRDSVHRKKKSFVHTYFSIKQRKTKKKQKKNPEKDTQ